MKRGLSWRRLLDLAAIGVVGFYLIPYGLSLIEPPAFTSTSITVRSPLKQDEDPLIAVHFCQTRDQPLAVTYSRKLTNATHEIVAIFPSAEVTIKPGCLNYAAVLKGIAPFRATGIHYMEWTYAYQGRWRSFVQTTKSNEFVVVDP